MIAVEPPQTLYNQPATHFAMPLYLRPDTEVEPQVILELCGILSIQSALSINATDGAPYQAAG